MSSETRYRVNEALEALYHNLEIMMQSPNEITDEYFANSVTIANFLLQGTVYSSLVTTPFTGLGPKVDAESLMTGLSTAIEQLNLTYSDPVTANLSDYRDSLESLRVTLEYMTDEERHAEREERRDIETDYGRHSPTATAVVKLVTEPVKAAIGVVGHHAAKQVNKVVNSVSERVGEHVDKAKDAVSHAANHLKEHVDFHIVKKATDLKDAIVNKIKGHAEHKSEDEGSKKDEHTTSTESYNSYEVDEVGLESLLDSTTPSMEVLKNAIDILDIAIYARNSRNS